MAKSHGENNNCLIFSSKLLKFRLKFFEHNYERESKIRGKGLKIIIWVSLNLVKRTLGGELHFTGRQAGLSQSASRLSKEIDSIYLILLKNKEELK